MLIDFHTHIFPEKIASAALQSLMKPMLECSGEIYPPQTDGTSTGLLKSMSEAGVDISVTMPIATKPSQEESINRFSDSINEQRIFKFGAVHPLSDDAFAVLEQLSKKGIRGVKIHPEFQDFYIDSDKSIKFLQKAESLGLFVMVHAGADVGFYPPVKCTPKGIANALSCIKGDRLIAAHLGGFQMWDDVEKYLAGKELWLDTAFISRFIEPSQCVRIIRKHGADKVLFGSDSPWESPKDTKAFIDSLALEEEERALIFYKNALRIID